MIKLADDVKEKNIFDYQAVIPKISDELHQKKGDVIIHLPLNSPICFRK